MRRAIFLALTSLFARSASASDVCEAALHEERNARKVDAVRYESALASLRSQLDLERRVNHNLRAACAHMIEPHRPLASESKAAGFRRADPRTRTPGSSFAARRAAATEQNGFGAEAHLQAVSGSEDRACSKAEAYTVL